MQKKIIAVISAFSISILSACGSESSRERSDIGQSGDAGEAETAAATLTVDGAEISLPFLQCTGSDVAGPGISRYVASQNRTSVLDESLTVTAFDSSVFEDAVSSKNAVVYQKAGSDSAVSWRSEAGVTIEGDATSGIVAKGKMRKSELKKEGAIFVDSGKPESEPKEFSVTAKCKS